MLKVSETGQEYIDEGEDGTLEAMLEALESLLPEPTQPKKLSIATLFQMEQNEQTSL